MNRSDEQYALELLNRHLVGITDRKFHSCPNENDPPDLLLTWENGARWGIEVTRSYQIVQQIGKHSLPASSETVIAILREFSERLERITREIRRRNYLLYLETPGPFSSWRKQLPISQWQKEVEKHIREHIVLDNRSALRFPGGKLEPGEPGKDWRVLLGGATSEVPVAIRGMLAHALRRKEKELPKWKDRFDLCFLLILNLYPLADNVNEVKEILSSLVREDEKSPRFDGILWKSFDSQNITCIYSCPGWPFIN